MIYKYLLEKVTVETLSITFRFTEIGILESFTGNIFNDTTSISRWDKIKALPSKR